MSNVTRVTEVPIPQSMARLDRDPRGYPIPFMVLRDSTGRPHFTVNDESKRLQCMKRSWCSVCGGLLPRNRWFAGGPLSAFHPNGAYFDPPMHLDCLRYSMRVCPYLATPRYLGRIDAGTLAEPTILVDSTMIPDRPEVFVCVLASGQDIVEGRVNLCVRPKRPYLDVEFWRHGERLEHAAGQQIVETALGGPLPELSEPRIFVARRRAAR